MLNDIESLKKMLIRRLNTTKLKSSDDLIDGIDLIGIKDYMIDVACKEISDDKLTLWHHLQYSYELTDSSTFEEIISCLWLENVFKPDPNSTAHKILDSIMSKMNTDSQSLLQKIIKDDKKEVSINMQELAEAM